MDLIEATFLERPNRYLIIAETEGEKIMAHCPNPGRLSELLFPGVRLLLSVPPSASAYGKQRKTAYTAEAALYKGQVVPLYAGKANSIAASCVLPVLFPPDAEIIPEYSCGSSRFDFRVLYHDGRVNRETLIEVKSCTLVHNRIAMFPDAPSSRALKHINELSEIAAEKRGIDCLVLFIIGHGNPAVFAANIHTDPDFCTALAAKREQIAIRAVSIAMDRRLVPELKCLDVPIDFSGSFLARANSGIYLILFTINSERIIRVGSLGEIKLKAGFYVYTGSARKNLRQRVARHLRKTKNTHWHVDYLSFAADKAKAYPVYADTGIQGPDRVTECGLAKAVGAIADGSVNGFGCSDCSCGSHLAWFSENPETDRKFIHTVLDYRNLFVTLPGEQDNQ